VTRAQAGSYPALAGCSSGSVSLGDYLPVPYRCLPPYLFYGLRDPTGASAATEPVFQVSVEISNPDGEIGIGFTVHYAVPQPAELAITYVQPVQVVHNFPPLVYAGSEADFKIHELPLIAGKRTVVRVWIKARGAGAAAVNNVSAVLRGYFTSTIGLDFQRGRCSPERSPLNPITARYPSLLLRIMPSEPSTLKSCQNIS